MQQTWAKLCEQRGKFCGAFPRKRATRGRITSDFKARITKSSRARIREGTTALRVFLLILIKRQDPPSPEERRYPPDFFPFKQARIEFASRRGRFIFRNVWYDHVTVIAKFGGRIIRDRFDYTPRWQSSRYFSLIQFRAIDVARWYALPRHAKFSSSNLPTRLLRCRTLPGFFFVFRELSGCCSQ